MGWLLALRHASFARWRHFANGLGVALSVAMVAAVVVSDRAVLSGFRQLLDAAAGRAELQVVSVADGTLPLELVAAAEEVPGVAAAVPSIRQQTVLLADEFAVGALLFGIDTKREPRLGRAELRSGRLPRAEERRTIALSEAIATDLGGLQLGSSVAVEAPGLLARFEVVGLLADSGGRGRESMGHFALISLASASELAGLAGRCDRLDLLLEPEADPEGVEQALESALGRGVRVDTPRGLGRDREQHLRSLEVLMALAAALACLAGFGMLTSNQALALRQRREELATLRLLGARRRDVLLTLLFEVGLVGMAGAALGTLGGVMLARWTTERAARDFLAAARLDGSTGEVGALGLSVIFLLGTLAPILLTLPAARSLLDRPAVLEVRRREEDNELSLPPRLPWLLPSLTLGGALLVWASLWSNRRPWVATVLLAIAFALVLYGLVGGLLRLLTRLSVSGGRLAAGLELPLLLRFALDHVVRAPRRAALLVLSLGAVLAMQVGIGTIARSQRATVDSWYSQRIRWDLAVLRSRYALLAAQSDLPSEVLSILETLPGAVGVSPQKFGVIGLAGQPANLWVFRTQDLAWYSSLALLEGDEAEAAAKLEAGGAALLSLPLARRLGIEVGERIELETPAGPRPFEVVGLIEELGSRNGTVQLDWNDYQRDFGTGFSQLVLKLAPGLELESARQELAQRLARFPQLRILSRQDFYREAFAGLTSFYRLLDGLVAVAWLTALAALANGLAISVIERWRSLALARLVGLLRKQVLQLLALEGLVLGVLAVLVGVPVGLFFGYGAVITAGATAGISLNFAFPVGACLGALAFALLAAPLAGLLPGARLARRLPLTPFAE